MYNIIRKLIHYDLSNNDNGGNHYGTKEMILEMTKGGLLYFQLYFKDQLEFNSSENRFKNIKNPFYDDTKPSFCIYYNEETKRWQFHDYGDTNYRGDVFDFAALCFGWTIDDHFYRILDKMVEVINQGQAEFPKYQNIIIKEGKKKNKQFELSWRYPSQANNDEKNFLKIYGIDPGVLGSEGVYFIDSVSANIDTPDFYHIQRKEGEIMWAVWREDEGYAKIYRPNPKRFLYVGNKPKDYIFGIKCNQDDQVAGDILILTGGEKDVLVLKSLGYNAACLNSETAIISEEVYNTLTYYFSNILVMYDLDETGIERSKELSAKHGFGIITLPQELKDKSGKDVADYMKIGLPVKALKEHIDCTIENYIGKKPKLLPAISRPIEIVPSSSLVRTANQRLIEASNLPPIKPLFGPFWCTNELTILFGDTGIGKSILAVAIGDALSRGVKLMDLDNSNEPLKILYLDFELSDRQFHKRYGDENKSDRFGEFFFVDYPRFISNSDKFDEIVYKTIGKMLNETGAQVLIVDNITALTSENTQDGQTALNVMKKLNQIKTELDISILVLAHTPKRYNPGKISINDLGGSKHLSNLADSVFTIGVSSKDSKLRYIKQIKCRSTDMIYGDNNVIVCELISNDNFLTFEFIKCDEELNHISTSKSESKDSLIQEVKKLRSEGKSIRDIATLVGISKSEVGRIVNDNK